MRYIKSYKGISLTIMLFRKIIYVLQSIGLGGIVRAIQYGFLRDKAEKGIPIEPNIAGETTPGNITESKEIPGGLQLNFENAILEVKFLTTNMMVFSWEPGKPPFPYTIAKSEWFNGSPVHEVNNEYHLLTHGQLQVYIDKHGAIRINHMDGKTLRVDYPPIRDGNTWKLSTELFPDEHIYGLGERAGVLNLRPGDYSSWNSDPGGNYSHGVDPLYIGTPIYLSISSAGKQLVYFENSYHSYFHIDDKFKVKFSRGMLRYYLIFGSLEEIYFQLSELVGKPFMPPRWALGYHQSRWGYRNEIDVKNVAKGFEDHDLPLSAIHLDIDYMDQFKVFTVNADRFPSLRQLTAFLSQKGIKIVTIVDPTVKADRNYSIYQNGMVKDVFCKLPDGNILRGVSWPGWSAYPDFSKPEARHWWSEKYRKLLDEGVAGIWHDMNEPASFAAWGDKSFPLTTLHEMDGQGGDHQEAHNLYGLLMDRAGYEALCELLPEKRPWIVSRSGWAGLQRYAWNWTADIESSWDALQQTIPTILGLGLSGQGFSGVDIGGFSGDPDAELYLRWFQMASFLPFFRTHSAIGTNRREPWAYGEPTTSIVRYFLNLRYKLLAYWYTLAWDSSQTGIPPLRPIFWENPSDQNLWDVQDEFMIGDALLVAPMLHKNDRNRQVVLPPGNWYSFWDDQVYRGVNPFEISAPLSNIPLFIKAGTVLPIVEDRKLNLHIYPGNENFSENHLYSDAGDGYGSWRVDRFHQSYHQKSLEITWIYEGDYTLPDSEVRYQLHGKKLINANCDEQAYSIHENSFITPFRHQILIDME
jgi:alpha-glucosidase